MRVKLPALCQTLVNRKMSKGAESVLPALDIPHEVKSMRRWQCLALVLMTVLTVKCYAFSYEDYLVMSSQMETHTIPLCPQAETRTPQKSAKIYAELNRLYHTEEFTDRVASWLSSAVQIPTEFRDAIGPIDGNPGWKIFNRFHNYLLSVYPLMYDLFSQPRPILC